MEHDTSPAHATVEPSGAQVREHWSMWQRFTSGAKVGIVVVAIIVIATVFFVTR